MRGSRLQPCVGCRHVASPLLPHLVVRCCKHLPCFRNQHSSYWHFTQSRSLQEATASMLGQRSVVACKFAPYSWLHTPYATISRETRRGRRRQGHRRAQCARVQSSPPISSHLHRRPTRNPRRRRHLGCLHKCQPHVVVVLLCALSQGHLKAPVIVCIILQRFDLTVRSSTNQEPCRAVLNTAAHDTK